MNDAEANLQMQLHLAVTCLATAAITIVAVTCLHDCGAYSMHFKWAYVHQNGRSSCCLQSSCSRLHGVRCRSNLSRFRNHHVSSIRTTSSTLFTNSTESAERDRIRRRRRRNLEHWGVENYRAIHGTSHPTFPSTFEAVADDAFRAIAGTICGLQRPDPNVASNAMHQSVLDYRPTHPPWASSRRWFNGDDDPNHSKKIAPLKKMAVPARMGIEIDGAAYLLPLIYHPKGGNSMNEGRAIKILSLEIARRLSVSPWDGFEETEDATAARSVAVYYNSMEQAILASRELRRWKQKKSTTQQHYDIVADMDHDSLDHIHICCLGQHSLPTCMIKQNKRQNKRISESPLTTNESNADNGIILICETNRLRFRLSCAHQKQSYHPR